jgi:hypothetical protein
MRTESIEIESTTSAVVKVAASKIIAGLNATLDLKALRFACERNAAACLR